MNDYSTSTDAFADISEANYSSSDYPAMAGFVTVASRLIDLEVGRWAGFFYPTTDSVTKYYDGSGKDEQDIGEWASVSSVSVSEQGLTSSSDYTAWATTDYLIWPYNYSAESKPITKLRIDINGEKAGFYRYNKSVSVTGVPGYSASVPDVIAMACRMQAVRYFMRAKQGYQDTGASVEMGGLTFKGQLQLDPDIKALLWPFILELDRNYD